MPDAEPYLRIENVTKKFGEFVAVSDISLTVDEQEFVCFLGPSGCGKTTLLRAIAGLDIQTSGHIRQGGRDISALPPSERDFGIVFQSYALFPNLTVYKNVAYGLENLKKPKGEIRSRVTELLQLVGLGDQGDKHPAQLSGGQQQRVALARALATSPGLLLLDEPLSALDAKVRVRLRHEIKDLQRRLGVTTIMVTHDQEEALTMADRIVVMNEGIIEQIGTPMEIYGEPATAFVADFIGTMNFLPGRVADDGTVRLGTADLACDPRPKFTGPVNVAIRPEDVIVRTEDAAGNDDNIMSVAIETLEFMGSSYRAELSEGDLDGNVLYADFSANLARRREFRPGDTISIRIPPNRLRLYEREDQP